MCCAYCPEKSYVEQTVCPLLDELWYSVTDGGTTLKLCSPGDRFVFARFCLLISLPLIPCMSTTLSQRWGSVRTVTSEYHNHCTKKSHSHNYRDDQDRTTGQLCTDLVILSSSNFEDDIGDGKKWKQKYSWQI